MIELGGGLIVGSGPGPATIMGDGCAAVVAVDNPIRVGGINPQAVVIAMRCAHGGERVPTIGGAKDAGIQHVNFVGIFGVGENVMEIPGALSEIVVAVHELPGIAAVVGAIDAAVIGLNDGVHTISVSARSRNTDSA